MAINSNRRRRLIVNAPVQNHIIRTISWPPVVALSVTTLMLGVFCTSLADEALVARVALPSLVPIFVTVIGFIVVSVGYVMLSALKFSHRFAGPMYRLRKTLEDVKTGDLTARANVRDGDFFEELADDLNEFLDWLEEHPPQGVDADPAAAADLVAADTVGDETAESAVATAPTADTTGS